MARLNTVAYSQNTIVKVPERCEDKEDGSIGRGNIDDLGAVRDPDAGRGTGLHVNVIVSRTY